MRKTPRKIICSFDVLLSYLLVAFFIFLVWPVPSPVLAGKAKTGSVPFPRRTDLISTRFLYQRRANLRLTRRSGSVPFPRRADLKSLAVLDLKSRWSGGVQFFLAGVWAAADRRGCRWWCWWRCSCRWTTYFFFNEGNIVSLSREYIGCVRKMLGVLEVLGNSNSGLYSNWPKNKRYFWVLAKTISVIRPHLCIIIRIRVFCYARYSAFFIFFYL